MTPAAGTISPWLKTEEAVARQVEAVRELIGWLQQNTVSLEEAFIVLSAARKVLSEEESQTVQYRTPPGMEQQ
jgi:hypothetical protein